MRAWICALLCALVVAGLADDSLPKDDLQVGVSRPSQMKENLDEAVDTVAKDTLLKEHPHDLKESNDPALYSQNYDKVKTCLRSYTEEPEFEDCLKGQNAKRGSKCQQDKALLKKVYGNCQEKKRAKQQEAKKCWNKTKAGMQKRQEERKKSKVRMDRVMERRKTAKDKMKKAWATQAEVVTSLKKALKAMKAEVAAYKNALEAAVQGTKSDMGEAANSSRGCTIDSSLMQIVNKAKGAVSNAEQEATVSEDAASSAVQAANTAQAAQDTAVTNMASEEEKAAAAEAAENTEQALVNLFPFSTTKASEPPECDKRHAEGKRKGQCIIKSNRKGRNKREDEVGMKRCQTQITVSTAVGGKLVPVRSQHTCTSCKPGSALIIQYHKSMAGKCEAYTQTEQSFCTVMDEDSFAADAKMITGASGQAASDKYLCTKMIQISQLVQTYNMDQHAKQYFNEKGVTKGTVKGSFTVQCRSHKQIACRANNDCETKGQMKCHQVCKTKDWYGGVKDCQKETCAGKYGRALCKQSSMLA